MENDFIIPTKKHPIFVAECDYFGYIECSVYKRSLVDGVCNYATFETDFSRAVNLLHEELKDGVWCMDFPKAKFTIYSVDGSKDKYGNAKMNVVYAISASKAKKLVCQR